MNTGELMQVLRDRSSEYGPYSLGIRTRFKLLISLKEAYREHHGTEMPWEFVEYFWDIVNKLSRLAVNPTHLDSWVDVQGYSRCIQATIEGNKNARKE
jgi:hypothetical protein